MPTGGVIVQWECKKCGSRGSLLFADGESVGRRLRECEYAHRAQDTMCKLDWDNIVVSQTCLPDDFFATNPRAS